MAGFWPFQSFLVHFLDFTVFTSKSPSRPRAVRFVPVAERTVLKQEGVEGAAWDPPWVPHGAVSPPAHL